MMEIGRVCMKIAGRDAGKLCAIVEIVDKNYVVIDGQTRRRKCNVDHLEPLMKVLDISEGASHEDVVSALTSLEGVSVKAKSSKPKKAKSESSVKKEAAPKKKVAKKSE